MRIYDDEYISQIGYIIRSIVLFAKEFVYERYGFANDLGVVLIVEIDKETLSQPKRDE